MAGSESQPPEDGSPPRGLSVTPPETTKIGSAVFALARACFNKPWAVVVGTVVLLAVSFLGAKRLRLDTDLTKLLPRTFESVRNLDVLAERSFGLGYVTVVASGVEPDQLRAFARDFGPKLEALESIQYVDYERPVKWFRDRALYYLELEELEDLRDQLEERYVWEVRKRSPMHDLGLEELGEAPELNLDELRNKQKDRAKTSGIKLSDEPFLIDEERKMIVLLAKPGTRSTDVGKADDVVKEVQALVDATDTSPYGNLEIQLSGSYKKKVDQKKQIEKDLSLSSALAAALMILYLGFHFRRGTGIALVLVPLLVGLGLTLGFAGFAIGSLNLLTGFIGAILLGIGIDHGIHLVGRFDEERQRGHTVQTALAPMFADSGRAALLAALTTIFAFAGVAFSEFRAFREFGILAAVGTGVILIAYCTVLPAMLALVPSGKPKAKKVTVAPFARALPRWAPMAFWLAALGAAGAVSFVNRTSFDYDFASLEDSSLPSVQLDKEVNRLLGRSQSPLVALGDGPEKEVAIAKAIRAKIEELGDESTVQMVLSLSDLVPPEQADKKEIMDEIRDTLERIKPEWLEDEQRSGREELLALTKPAPFTRDDLPKEVSRQFMGAASKDTFVLIFPAVSLSDGNGVRRLADQMATVKLPDGSRPLITGEPLVTADVLDMVFRESPTVLGVTALLVLIALGLALRRVWMAASCMMVATMTLLVTGGLMPLLNVQFNYLNVVMLPVLFGIGVDGSVHVVTRLHAGASIDEVVSETGRSIAGAILTTMLGFGAMLLADHPGLRSLGAVALIGLAVNLLVCLVLLPAFVALRGVTAPRRDDEAPRSFWPTLGATVGLAGLSPVAPGTMGALVAIPLTPLLALLSPAMRVIPLVLLSVGGWLVARRYMVGDDRDDPQEIVVDELAGCAIAVAVAPAEPLWVLVGFVLFRFFDIVKPWPINWLGDRHGAFGVMADDIAAGIAGAAIIALLRYGGPMWGWWTI